MWRGFYEKDGNKVDLAIKQLTCPIEGGEITGLTTEDKTVKGKIESNRKLAFENQPNDASMQSGFLGKAQGFIDGLPPLV